MIKILILTLSIVMMSTSFAAIKPFAEFDLGAKKYKVQKLADGLGIVWGMDFLDSNTMIFTEKNGKIQKLTLKTGEVSLLKNPPISSVHGQGGLLDIAVHPDFSKNKWVYATYTKNVNGKFTTAVARAQLNGTTFSKWNEFFVAEPASTKGEHFGSRLVFDKKGYIFFTVGERGERDNAQKLTTHTGKVMRLKENGDLPEDNPFVGDPLAKKEIWSYGQRNPQGLFYDLDADTLWENEHGPQGGDEINIIKKGANYGWPVATYGKEYGSGKDIGEGPTKSGVEAPIKYYVPSIGPSGLTLYKGSKLPDLKNFLITGSLPLTHLNFVRMEGKGFCEMRLLKDSGDRFRDVATGPDELIYVSTDSGKILRIEMCGDIQGARASECAKPKERML